MSITLHTPTPDLKVSKAFYQKIGFQVIPHDSVHYMTDGKAMVEINPDRFARPGVKLYREDWGEMPAQLAALTTVHEHQGNQVFQDTSGAWVYLATGKGIHLEEVNKPATALLGNYMGISMEAFDLGISIKLWETLGFTITAGGQEQGWLVMVDEFGAAISLMKAFSCPHLFFNPSFTYFNGANNPGIIQQLRNAQVDLAEEVKVFNDKDEVDNVILRDPGGCGFFLFND